MRAASSLETTETNTAHNYSTWNLYVNCWQLSDNFLTTAIKVIIEKSPGEGSLMEQDTIENVS